MNKIKRRTLLLRRKHLLSIRICSFGFSESNDVNHVSRTIPLGTPQKIADRGDPGDENAHARSTATNQPLPGEVKLAALLRHRCNHGAFLRSEWLGFLFQQDDALGNPF